MSFPIQLLAVRKLRAHQSVSGPQQKWQSLSHSSLRGSHAGRVSARLLFIMLISFAYKRP
jgi:hypothetical protein